MKKLLIALVGLLSLIVLTGCTNDQEVELLRQQNILLQQQVSQQQQINEEINNNIQTNYGNSESSDQNNNTTSNNYDTPTTNYNTPDYNVPSQSSCCKICSKGKACWDSCISKSYTCHKWVGCACDG